MPSNPRYVRGQISLPLIIVVLVLVVIAVAFYFSGSAHAPSQAVSTATTTQTSTTTPEASLQSSVNAQGGFTVSYPAGFIVSNSSSITPVTDWRVDSQDPGVLAFTLSVPQSFEPKTNFSEAKLTVGYSANDVAIKNCCVPLSSAGPAAVSTTTINGVAFQKNTGSDAGAGNLYDTTSYRTMHAGKCYTIEYTIHSTQLANYPESAGINAFDRAKVESVLSSVVSSLSLQ